MNELQNFSKGDILKAFKRNKKEGYHYIVYYQGNSNDDFIGGMLTHSDTPRNVKMSECHFERLDENGKAYTIYYNNSFLVKGKFIKPREWGPFTKVGKLTLDGIKFVENVIENLNCESFEDYLSRN